MEERQLGSVIFMSTSQYLSILLSLPCPNCLDLIASNRTFYTRVSGFNIYCVITCLLCKTSTQYSNEDSGMKYSQVVAGAALAGGVNRNSFQTALATIGVTNQWYNYQPVIGFHMIENPRTIRKSNNDFSKIVYKGNFDGTSR
ncbi:hypothetical protein RhiirB3_453272 [Rhizophagus irregularis]|nr:hypothetical protein RhiirB3_453272 [Rhizophagus irregularis]